MSDIGILAFPVNANVSLLSSLYLKNETSQNVENNDPTCSVSVQLLSQAYSVSGSCTTCTPVVAGNSTQVFKSNMAVNETAGYLRASFTVTRTWAASPTTPGLTITSTTGVVFVPIVTRAATFRCIQTPVTSPPVCGGYLTVMYYPYGCTGTLTTPVTCLSTTTSRLMTVSYNPEC